MAPFIVLIVFCVLAIAGWVFGVIAEYKADREMIAKGYVREFVISCSADPGGWELVKK